MEEQNVYIFTPVFNGEEYLRECIQSILDQTHENWIYRIVDNCSDDATPYIADEYAKKESRVQLIREDKFVGINDNHNRGYALIDNDSLWCKVVQADDWIYPECLERMIDVGISNPSIGFVSAYRLWDTVVDLVGVPYHTTVVSGTEMLAQCLSGGPYTTGAPTAHLIRSDLIRKRTPFYDQRYWHADTDAAYWTLTQSDFACVHQVLTFARHQPDATESWSSKVNSYDPENLRFLIAYGKEALGPRYRRS